MTESRSLGEYLEVIGQDGEGNDHEARLASGQFHDVVLLGEVAYRFPRDENSRSLLPARAELLSKLGSSQLPFAMPVEQVAGPWAEETVVSCLAQALSRLNELGKDLDIRETVPRSDPRRWKRFAEDVSVILFPLMSSEGQKRAEAELEQVLALNPAGDALVHGDLGGANLLWANAESGPQLTGILDWDEAQIGNQADDLASIAVTVGWPLARRLDAQRHGGDTPTIPSAEAIAATFALQQALPAALSGDADSLADGLSAYHGPR